VLIPFSSVLPPARRFFQAGFFDRFGNSKALFFHPPATPRKFAMGSMMRPITPMPISALREGPPTRRDLAFGHKTLIFNREALRASAHSTLPIVYYIPLKHSLPCSTFGYSDHSTLAARISIPHGPPFIPNNDSPCHAPDLSSPPRRFPGSPLGQPSGDARR
jgi:hypothetical protein